MENTFPHFRGKSKYSRTPKKSLLGVPLTIRNSNTSSKLAVQYPDGAGT
jgi:hypothetical protein